MIAIDQSRLQAPPPGNEPVVVPDICLYENIKGSGWQKFFFSNYREQPKRIHVAYPIGVLMREELAAGQPVATIVDWEWSELLQREIGNKQPSPALIQRVERLKSRPLEPEANLKNNKEDLKSGLRALKHLVGDKLFAALRQSANPQDRTQLSEVAPTLRQLALRTLPHILEDLGIANPQQSSLYGTPSMLLRYEICRWMHIFQFARNSGSVHKEGKQLLNDLVDSDYALIGTYCDDLLTGEPRMQERYEGIKAALL